MQTEEREEEGRERGRERLGRDREMEKERGEEEVKEERDQRTVRTWTWPFQIHSFPNTVLCVPNHLEVLSCRYSLRLRQEAVSLVERAGPQKPDGGTTPPRG